jgi:hypothetical protein
MNLGLEFTVGDKQVLQKACTEEITRLIKVVHAKYTGD